MPFSSPVRLLIGVVIFAIVFLLLAVVTQTLNKADLGNVRGIANAMGPLRKPLTLVINIIEKLMNALQREKKT
ncbi:MAG: hypothetical protein M1167_06500 [Chloroflexi bacterium]|nr:hypothetical protein [Chloroflexota bacterium]